MKPKKVQPTRLDEQRPMQECDMEEGTGLAKARKKRSVKNLPVLLVCPRQEEWLPGDIAEQIPKTRLIHSRRDVPQTGLQIHSLCQTGRYRADPKALPQCHYYRYQFERQIRQTGSVRKSWCPRILVVLDDIRSDRPPRTNMMTQHTGAKLLKIL